MTNSTQTYGRILYFLADSKDINTVRKILEGIRGYAVPENSEEYSDIERLRAMAIQALDDCNDSATMYDVYDRYVNLPFQEKYNKY